jgi:hypothetical protein
MPPDHPTAIPAAEASAATQALEALASELTACGWTARVHTPQGGVPSLYVENPGTPMLSEHIYAGSAADGTWSYWWSWADTIAPATDPRGTAATITRVLGAAIQPEPAP